MGQKLIKYFGFAEQHGGVKAKMRLAMQTGISSVSAADAPDSPENIQKFQAAIKEITGQDAPQY